MRSNAVQQVLRKFPQARRLRHPPQRLLRQRQKSSRRQLLPFRRMCLRRSIRKRQNHVSYVQSNALFGVLLSGNKSQRQVLQAFANLTKLLAARPPHQHPRVPRIRKVKLSARSSFFPLTAGLPPKPPPASPPPPSPPSLHPTPPPPPPPLTF